MYFKAMKKWLNSSGPGVLVAAAFIGPGTVTVSTVAGANFGFALLWALVLSVVGTIVLQEMAARLGLVTNKGLATVIKNQIKTPNARLVAILLMLSAIFIGNTAYEAGNISGGVLGVEALGFSGKINIGGQIVNLWSWCFGGVAALLLYIGNYKILERLLVTLVIFMSVSFVIVAVLTKPDILALLKGSFVPSLPEGSLLTVIGLVGTTIVPYNLFLHASLVQQKWKGSAGIPAARKDIIVAVILGGLVSMCIVIASAALKGGGVSNAADLAKSVEPIFGKSSRYFIGIGLAAAGLTSAITAPLAAAFVVQGCLGWERNLKSVKFRAVWGVVLGIGVVFSSLGYKPIEVIKFAQIANGVLLPVVAGYLLWVVNQKAVLGAYVNSRLQNFIGVFIWLIVASLSIRSLLTVAGVL